MVLINDIEMEWSCTLKQDKNDAIYSCFYYYTSSRARRIEATIWSGNDKDAFKIIMNEFTKKVNKSKMEKQVVNAI